VSEPVLPRRPEGATRVVLIRHGETTERARGTVYGSLDVPLSRRGVAQARGLAAVLASTPVDAVYSSPRRRAVETARSIGEPTILDALGELNFGAFEGRTYDEIARDHPELYSQWMSNPTSVRFPGGESYKDLSTRVTTAIRERRGLHVASTFAVVAHGGVVRALIAEALQMPDTAIFSIGCDFASISVLDWYGNTPVLAVANLCLAGRAFDSDSPAVV
jgi:alpha-ribazole phosphatase